MKTVTIYGASDNLIETEGIEGCDEFDAGGHPYHAGVIIIKGGDARSLEVHCIYSGYWCFGIGSPDAPNFDEFPDWPIRRTFGTKKSYSETLEIDVPDNAVLSFLENE